MGTSYHRSVAKYESERENVSNMKTFEEKFAPNVWNHHDDNSVPVFKWAIVPIRISAWDISFDVQLGLCQTVDPA